MEVVATRGRQGGNKGVSTFVHASLNTVTVFITSRTPSFIQFFCISQASSYVIRLSDSRIRKAFEKVNGRRAFNVKRRLQYLENGSDEQIWWLLRNNVK